MRAVALTVASGGLYGACFPTWSLQSLAWVALVPFLLALRGASVRGVVGLAWLWTLVEERLKDRFFADPTLAGMLGELEDAVGKGELTPSEAARRVLEAFSSAARS